MVPAQLYHARKLLQRDILIEVLFDKVRDLNSLGLKSISENRSSGSIKGPAGSM
jgi:hypothetical protein